MSHTSHIRLMSIRVQCFLLYQKERGGTAEAGADAAEGRTGEECLSVLLHGRA